MGTIFFLIHRWRVFWQFKTNRILIQCAVPEFLIFKKWGFEVPTLYKTIIRTKLAFHSTDSSFQILAHASVIESRVLFTRTVRTSSPKQTEQKCFQKKNVLITYLSLQQSKHITITIFSVFGTKAQQLKARRNDKTFFWNFSSRMLDFRLVYTELFILHISFLRQHVNLLPAINSL